MGQKTKRTENNISKSPYRGAIFRITLIISLLLHGVVVLAIQEAFPVNWFSSPMRTYYVELLRPPVDPLINPDAAGADLAATKAPEKKPAQETEDTISLETKDQKYIPYVKIIKERLMRHWKYPREAWENLIEGELLVIFRLDRQGRLLDVDILRSSDFNVLDAEAVRTIQAAAPFPSFPSSVTVTRLNIKASFAYRFTTSR